MRRKACLCIVVAAVVLAAVAAVVVDAAAGARGVVGSVLEWSYGVLGLEWRGLRRVVGCRDQEEAPLATLSACGLF